MLHVNKQRAIAGLSQGQSSSAVAKTIGVTRQTLCRWKKDAEFKTTMDREVGEMMSNIRNQIQITAKTLVEGGMEGAQQLRFMLVQDGVEHHDRRLSAQCLLKHAQRFWDMMGFSANAKNPSKLLCDVLEQDSKIQNAAPLPETIGSLEPGDRHLRSESERDPPGQHHEATVPPVWLTDWAYNPVHDDGTPIGPPDYFHRDTMLANVPEEAYDQVKAAIRHGDLDSDYDVEKIVAKIAAEQKQAAEDAEKLKLQAPSESQAQTQPQSKPKPKRIRKAWKRSATTLRCQPEKSASADPIAASAQRVTAANSAAHRAPSAAERPLDSATSSLLSNAHAPG